MQPWVCRVSEHPVTDEARDAAHEATACNLGEPGWTDMMGKSPYDLIDMALDAAAPLIRAAERERWQAKLDAVRALLTSGPVGLASGERYIRADLIRDVLAAEPEHLTEAELEHRCQTPTLQSAPHSPACSSAAASSPRCQPGLMRL
jgi:hypothetical protein